MFVSRVCHTACLGGDGDVVVFGGSSHLCILVDSVCKSIFIFPVFITCLYDNCHKIQTFVHQGLHQQTEAEHFIVNCSFLKQFKQTNMSQK